LQTFNLNHYEQACYKFSGIQRQNHAFFVGKRVYWVALKPVCEALNVEYTRIFKNVKADPILGPALAIQPMQISGDDQVRQMVCLPEFLIYGWIFSIKSSSKELILYKQECYKALFEYFHGAITARKELIKEKASIQKERLALESELRSTVTFNRFEQLKASEARIGIQLKKLDNEEFENQMTLFS
jgi:hypothetical protein